MKSSKIIVGELVVLIASVFVFRSLWLILDKHFGDTYLEVMLTVSIAIMVLGLFLLHYCIKCELKNLSV
jgi:uncharacterized membrane protein YidH (DUF202 family)